MHPFDVDRAFARFRRARDPNSLGQVFDATAPELLRLAAHLCGGDRERAEELVQQTFLSALEAPELHDGQRAVLPWLCGILANRARMERRGRRTAARHRAPLPDLASVDPGPLDRAMAGETNAVLDARLDALDEPYRAVLKLFLRHGLSPAEIADALDRPGATVRSQLHRGLERLRRTLPALGVATVSMPAWDVVALAGLRTKLCVAAGLSPVPVSGLATLGGLMMSKKILLGGVAVVAAIVVTTLTVQSPGLLDPPHPTGTTPQGSARSTKTITARADLTADGSEFPLDRAPVDRRERSASQVLVRITRADGSKPAASCTVHFRPTNPFDPLAERIVHSTADEPGEVLFDDVPAGPAVVFSHRGGRAELVVEVERLHEVTLAWPESRDVRGQVVDARSGRPIVGAALWVSAVGSRAEGAAQAESDGTGNFVLLDATADQHVSAWAPGYAPSSCVPAWTGDALRDDTELRIELRPEGAYSLLAGRVLDPFGEPVESALVRLGPVAAQPLDLAGPLPPPEWFRRTDVDGRFSLPVPARGGRLPLWVRARGHALWFDWFEPEPHTGENPLTIRLSPGGRLSGRVADAGGEAVADARITLRDPRIETDAGIAWQGPSWARDATRTDGGGIYVLEHVRAGTLKARALEGGRLATTSLTLTDDTATTWNPILGAGLTIEGTVVDEADRPLAGWAVRASAGSLTRWPEPVTTGADGRFFLSGAEPSAYRLTIAGPDSAMHQAAAVVEDVDPTATAPLRVVVPSPRHPDATLRGRLLDGRGEPLPEARIEPLLACPDGVRESAARTLPLDDGHFTLGLLRPGSYRIQAHAGSLTFDLGEHTLAPDQSLDLGTHRAAATGRLLITVVDPRGEPLPDVDLTIQGPGEPRSRLLSDPAAEQELLPGTWKVSTWGRDVVDITRQVQVSAERLQEFRFVVPDGVRVQLRMPGVPRQFYELRQVWRNLDTGEVLIDDTSSWNNVGRAAEFDKLVPAGRYEVVLSDASGTSGPPTLVHTAKASSERVELHAPQ